ncbi:LysR family transcriptional regulator [Trinickia dinghuensis]|uniref:LysR family transcriptional regulator n=1 Tax=Trinickia dinghuensis TaxID=2291023 RepID=A0A3D8K3B5_9BURK|nr:LysR substrate-binding domain-containing protein [Trinickia dinghuensis]RDU99081.1 LysR family transcriptional regulator [Trinickia dinghuensis]
MNLQQLRAFSVVAQQQSIRGAAPILGLSQPAVTRLMRELEKSVGAVLLHRSSQGIELTEFGHALLKRAHLILEEVRSAQDELDQMQDGAGGTLDIAISSTAALSIFPRALRTFRQRMPRVELSIAESSPPSTQDQLASGQLDFAIVNELDDHPADGFNRQILFSTQLIIVGRKGHPLRHAVSIAELRDTLWLMPGFGYASTDFLERMFRENGYTAPQDVIACSSLVTALSIVENSDALGMFSEAILGTLRRTGAFSAITTAEPLPAARVSLVTRDNGRPTPAARCFIECLRDASTR